MSEQRNIPPEIADAIEEGRRLGIQEALAFIRGMREKRRHEMFRGIWAPVDAEGWELLSDSERRLLESAANALAAKNDLPAVRLDLTEHNAEIERRWREKEEEEMRARVAQYLRSRGEDASQSDKPSMPAAFDT